MFGPDASITLPTRQAQFQPESWNRTNNSTTSPVQILTSQLQWYFMPLIAQNVTCWTIVSPQFLPIINSTINLRYSADSPKAVFGLRLDPYTRAILKIYSLIGLDCNALCWPKTWPSLFVCLNGPQILDPDVDRPLVGFSLKPKGLACL